MTTVTTAGMIIILLLLSAAFFAGIWIGSFHTKRKAEAIMKAKGWIAEAEGSFSFNHLWRQLKGKI